MFSIYTLKSAEDASERYAKSQHCTTNPLGNSCWFGQGAERLELQGVMELQVFQRLLGGYLPDGAIMTQSQKNKYHRPGYHLTFLAPKSISILALVADNQPVWQAHREAVKETLSYFEKKYAGVRNKKMQEVTFEKTANLIFGIFEEYESLAGDPQLQDHVVLMNLTQRLDGSWNPLYFDDIDWEMLGYEYRAFLAPKLMAAGYLLDFTGGGRFEISGVPKKLLELFSKSRINIKV